MERVLRLWRKDSEMPRVLEAETKLEKNSELSEEAKRTETRWTWVMVALCLALAVGTVVVVVIALEPSSTAVPETIDVVLYQAPQTSRMVRYVPHSKAVWQHLPWVRKIFVLSQYATPGWDPTLDVEVVSFTGSESEAFEFMPLIPGIASHALFLSDRTVPLRHVKKSYFFYQTRPRIFNIFRDQAEVNFLSAYLELPTMPVLATDLVKLGEDPRTWQDLVFREVTEERVLLREDMNRDILITSKFPVNTRQQFEKLVSAPPLFATFHVSPEDPNPVEANGALTTFLAQQFP